MNTRLTETEATQPVLGQGIKPPTIASYFAMRCTCGAEPAKESTPVADAIEGATTPDERRRLIEALVKEQPQS